MKQCCCFAVVLCAVFGCSRPALAQRASLSGTVVDQSGGVLRGVAVTLVNLDQGLKREAVTDQRGAFSIPLLSPGRYSLTAQLAGFAPSEVKELALNVGDELVVALRLEVAKIGEAVTVTAEPPRVNTSAALGAVIDRQFVENLPLNGRTFHSLIALIPGVVVTKASGGDPGQFSVNGQRTNANNYIVDGVSANVGVNPGNNVGGQATAGTVPGVSATGGLNNLVTIDAMQEFRITTSTFAPEFGRTPGGQISIVTRSGSNELHGTLFEYFRNEALDATDFFVNRRGIREPPLRQNDFGGVAGGPIQRNRLFFFGSYEGLRVRLPQTAVTPVPSMELRNSVPAALRPYVNAYPLPNGRELTGGFAEHLSSYSDPSSLDTSSIRVDHAAGPLTVFGRYNYSPSDSRVRSSSNRSVSTALLYELHTVTAGSTLMLGPNLANDLRVNYTRNFGTSRWELDAFDGAQPPVAADVLPYGTALNSMFGFCAVSSCLTLGSFGTDIQKQLNMVNTLSLSAGAHQFRFGLDYRRLTPTFDRLNYSQQVVTDGTLLRRGEVSLAVVSAFDGPLHPVFTNVSTFAQDTWRASPRLTLTYGIRWEVNPAPASADGKTPLAVTGLDNPATFTLAPQGTKLFNTSYTNIAPRVGVAYQLSTADGRESVLRGGFGVFFDLGMGPAASAFGYGYPFFRQVILRPPAGTTGFAFPLNQTLATPPPVTIQPPYGSIRGVIDPEFALPFTRQWNVTFEQRLGAQHVSASYVGAGGRDLPRTEFVNAPNPNFQSVYVTRNSAESDYRALQLQYRRPLSRGLQAMASYTWSVSEDNASSDAGFEVPLDRLDPANERGPSDFDIRHVVSGGVTYAIPSPSSAGMWQAALRDYSVDATFIARSAEPINIITGTTGIGGTNVQRPDVVPGTPFWLDDPNAPGGRRINRAAFANPAPGRQGTLGRNALRGFPAWQVDLAIRRSFNLPSATRLQLRAEIFNALNHANFADPGAPGTTSNRLSGSPFGESTTMLNRGLGSGFGALNPLYQFGGPRSIQLAMRLEF